MTGGGDGLIGVVLAAGAGRRLQPLTDELPKTLLPVKGETTILELTLRNLAAQGIADVVVVTGFAEGRVRAVVPELEARCGVRIELVYNDKATVWNNAYSLWCAREHFARGVLLCNGDTVHPVEMQRRLLSQRGPGLLLALDTHKPLGEEEMKVVLDGSLLRRINKAIPPADAHGEYVGLTIIEPVVGDALTDALERTFQRDPGLYYEDAYQDLLDRGGEVHAAPVSPIGWIEVDNHEDLARARAITAEY